MAAGGTYTPIATYTFGADAASYTFSSIPTTYTDLVLVASGIQTNATLELQVGNGSVDTGTNYSRVYAYGYASAASSARGANLDRTYSTFGSPSVGVGNSISHFMSYSSTSIYKTILTRGNNVEVVSMTASLWRSTSAINTIKVSGYLANILAGTTLTLYGIAAA